MNWSYFLYKKRKFLLKMKISAKEESFPLESSFPLKKLKKSDPKISDFDLIKKSNRFHFLLQKNQTNKWINWIDKKDFLERKELSIEHPNFLLFDKNKKLKDVSKSGYSKIHELKLISIEIASSEKIKSWAEKILPNGKIFGEVTNANTLHYKTFKPHKGGLFCERIFGPLKDFECACGVRSKFLNSKKEKKEQKKRFFCPQCDVEYTWSVIRRYQLGYIQLVSPVSHIWFLKASPSYLSLLLDLSRSHLESIVYCVEPITLENLWKNSENLGINQSPSTLYSIWQKLLEEEKKQLKIQNNNKKILSRVFFEKDDKKRSKFLKSYKKKPFSSNFFENSVSFLEFKKEKLFGKHFTALSNKQSINKVFLIKKIQLKKQAIYFERFDFENFQKLSKKLFLKIFFFSRKRLFFSLKISFEKIFQQKISLENSLKISNFYSISKELKKEALFFAKSFFKIFFRKASFKQNHKSNLKNMVQFLCEFFLFSFLEIQLKSSINRIIKNFEALVIKRNEFDKRKNQRISIEKDEKTDTIKYQLSKNSKIFTLKRIKDINSKILQIDFKVQKSLNNMMVLKYYSGMGLKKKQLKFDRLLKINFVKKIFFINRKNFTKNFINKKKFQKNFLNFFFLLAKNEKENLNGSIIDLLIKSNSFYSLPFEKILYLSWFYTIFAMKNKKSNFFEILQSNNFIWAFNEFFFDKKTKQKNQLLIERGKKEKLDFKNVEKQEISKFNKLLMERNPFSMNRKKKFFKKKKNDFALRRQNQSIFLFIGSKLFNKKKESNFFEPPFLLNSFEKKPFLKNDLYTVSYNFLWPLNSSWKFFFYYSSGLKNFSDRDFPYFALKTYDSLKLINKSVDNWKLKQSNKVSNFYQLISKDEIKKIEFFSKIKSPLSGASILKKLLSEYNAEELKKMVKQHQVLLPKLNNAIRKLKEKAIKKFDFVRIKKFLKKRDHIIKRLKLIRKFSRKNMDASSMILSVLPVLPPDLRPILKLPNQIAASDLNRLYQRILYRNERLKKFLKDPSTSQSFEMRYAQRLLQEAVDNLIQNGKGNVKPETNSRGQALKSLSEILKGKQGRFRQYLLGKRVDYSGRSVIVVGPKFKFYECGLPKEMAMELFLPFLIKRIFHYKLARTVVGAKNFLDTNKTYCLNLLQEIMKNHPILLNRAPTLHRLGIQAFQPKLVDGRAILLHPLVCPSFNADFDGDQMAVHLPLTVEARAEAWNLLFSRNHLISAATGDPIFLPSQDMVLGCYYLTSEKKISQKNFLNSIQTRSASFNKKNQKKIFFLSNILKFERILNAYQLGKISFQAIVWMKWNGQVQYSKEPLNLLEIRLNRYGTQDNIQTKSYKRIQKKPLRILSHYTRTTPGRILINAFSQKFHFIEKKSETIM